MKTQVIDRTQGGSAETVKVGDEGYFWDGTGGFVLKAKIYKIESEQRFPYVTANEKAYAHFSRTIPDWFLPAEKKPIELVKVIYDDGIVLNANLSPSSFKTIERIVMNVHGFDLIKGTTEDGPVYWYLGHWHDGVV